MGFEKTTQRITPALENQEQENKYISSERFLEQIAHEQVMEIHNPERRLCHQLRYTEILPDISISDEYVVFIGGFGANSLAYDAQLYELARRGRKVIYLNPLEGLAGSEEEQTYAKDTGIPGIIQNKASEVSRLLKELGIARVDVVGHSQGGAVATLLAATHPDMVKKLVLDTPAGLVGQKTSAELITRSLDEAASEYVYARKKMEDDGEIKIVGGVYSLSQGKIELL
jgi:pimeloyl-ACP methyl ester carboxylesterase